MQRPASVVRTTVLVLAVGLLGLGILRNAWPWIVDDAFISLRYAERLAAGDGLTWTDGERVEGYSNLSWVLMLAGLGGLGCDWIDAVRGLGIACTVATFAVLLGSGLLPTCLPALLAVGVLAALGTTSVWAIGGLESPLLMLLVAIAMAGLQRGLTLPAVQARRPLWYAGVALGIACWTRPDAPLWAVVAAGTALLWRSPAAVECGRLRVLVWLLAPSMAALLLQLGFRIVYYGDWLPNTGRAKVSPSAESRRVGWAYVVSAAWAMRALLVPAVLGLGALWQRTVRPQLAFALVGSLVWWLYILQIGGDSFPRSRLLVPSLAPLTLLAAHGLALVARRGRAGWVVAAVAALLAIGVARFDAESPAGDPRQTLPKWEWWGVGTGDWLGRAFANQRPLVAVDAAGGVPFASRLPCLDMLGLCDRTIASTPVSSEQAFVPGHTRANGAYVLSREPDLVLFGLPPGAPQPQWLGGRQMEASPIFRRDYRVVLFQTGDLRLGDGSVQDLRITGWARLGGRLGVQTTAEGVRVPGYWLGSYRQPYSFHEPRDEHGAPIGEAQRQRDILAGAQWLLAAPVVGVFDAPQQHVVGEVRRAGRHTLEGLPLPAGRYRVHAPELPAGVTLAVDLVEAVDGVPIDLTLVVPEGTALPFRIDWVDLRRVE